MQGSAPSTMENVDGSWIYCRTRSTKREELENALLALYGVTSETHVAFIFPSGMSAISAIMHAFARPDRQIVLGDEHYCDTPKVALWLSNLGLARRTAIIGSDDADDLTVATSLVLVETCSNPSGIVPDYELISKMKSRDVNTVVCLDNTWLTAALFNPWAAGVPCDIVVESMSKYLSGGQCIGGMCIAKIECAAAIFQQIRLNGLHVTRETCEIVLGSLPSLAERVLSASVRSASMRKALGIPIPEPFCPPVFTVTIVLDKMDAQLQRKVRKRQVRAKLEQQCRERGIRFETSFGAAHSKIDCYPQTTTTTVRIRIAAGYADDGSDAAIVQMVGDILKAK